MQGAGLVMGALDWLLSLFVLAGTLPVLSGSYQALLAGIHRFRRSDPAAAVDPPRIAVIASSSDESGLSVSVACSTRPSAS